MMKTSIALMSLGGALGQDAAACTDATGALTPYEQLKAGVSSMIPIITSDAYAAAVKKDACIDQPAEPACVVQESSAMTSAVVGVFMSMDMTYTLWAGGAGATCVACIQNGGPTGRRLDGHAEDAEAEAAEAAAGMAFLSCGGIAPMTHDAINALEAPVCNEAAVAVLFAGRRLDGHEAGEEAPGLDAAFVPVDAVGVDCFQCTTGVGVQGDPTAEQMGLMAKCIGQDAVNTMIAAEAAGEGGADDDHADDDHADHDHADDDHADDADDAETTGNTGSESGDGDNAAGLATFTAMALAFFMW